MDLEFYTEMLPIAVATRQVPRYLYKYRTIDGNFLKIIENNELWFSSPEDFNDPFDCQIYVDANNTAIQVEELIRKTIETELPEEYIRKKANEAITEPDRWENILNDSFKEIINSHGICCFAKTEKTTLLWSHYTNCHKGLCLKFDVLADPAFFTVPLPVNYQKEYPYYNHLDNPKELVNKLILTKSDAWNYEDEIRLIKFDAPGLHKFNKSALVEIIFGCRSDQENIDHIKELAKKHGYNHIAFKKAIRKKNEYGFDFINI